jgi:hypothetical protein
MPELEKENHKRNVQDQDPLEQALNGGQNGNVAKRAKVAASTGVPALGVFGCLTTSHGATNTKDKTTNAQAPVTTNVARSKNEQVASTDDAKNNDANSTDKHTQVAETKEQDIGLTKQLDDALSKWPSKQTETDADETLKNKTIVTGATNGDSERMRELINLRQTAPEQELEKRKALWETSKRTYDETIASLESQIRTLHADLEAQKAKTIEAATAASASAVETKDDATADAGATAADATSISVNETTADAATVGTNSKVEDNNNNNNIADPKADSAATAVDTQSRDANDKLIAEVDEHEQVKDEIVRAFQDLTSTRFTVEAGPEDGSRVIHALSFNRDKRRAIKYSIKIPSGQGDATFTPTGNVQYLPDFLQQEISFHRDDVWVLFSKILRALH